jgi:[ribosomal protein S5]-alanine N-acetyltransferase
VTLSAPEPPLDDGVVSLRPLDERDLPVLERALGDPEIGRWLDNTGLTPRDVLVRTAAQLERGDGATLAIVAAGACVGSIWLNLGPSGRAGVGYWLLAEARGRGLVARALALVVRWAFADNGVQRLSLLADPRNAASIRVAERAGFVREGVLRSWVEVNGERVDHVSFSLLPGDVPEQ